MSTDFMNRFYQDVNTGPPSDRFCRVQDLPASSVEFIRPITELYFRQILSTDFMNRFYLDVKTGPEWEMLEGLDAFRFFFEHTVVYNSALWTK